MANIQRKLIMLSFFWSTYALTFKFERKSILNVSMDNKFGLVYGTDMTFPDESNHVKIMLIF